LTVEGRSVAAADRRGQAALRCIGGIVPGCAIAVPSPIANLAVTTTVPFLAMAHEAAAADIPATNFVAAVGSP
jgi:hypothetical protein